MTRCALATVCLLITLLLPGPAPAQTPSPEALAAARQVMEVSHAADNLKTLMPAIMKNLKPAIVQGRPQIEKDFDAIAPLIVNSLGSRVGELIDQVAIIYANTFTVDEMKTLVAFYKTPVGQKLLASIPKVAQQSMAAGQQFGAKVGRELQARIIEELRKKGDDI
jgi:hypothetical protein